MGRETIQENINVMFSRLRELELLIDEIDVMLLPDDVSRIQRIIIFIREQLCLVEQK